MDVVDVAVGVVVDPVAGDLAELTQMLAARSGWSSRTPESITATTTPAPCESSQARGQIEQAPGCDRPRSPWRASCGAWASAPGGARP